MTPTQADLAKTRPMPEQITYANVLFWGAMLGILLSVISYTLYLTGLLEPHATIDVVTSNWSNGVGNFSKVTNAPHGWGWLALILKGDYLNYIGMVLLAGLTVVCYLLLLPGYIRRKDWLYTSFCVAEVVVLVLAASGIFGAGGH